MGLDLALGAVVLIAALRGWFKGFVRQAVTLGALAGCVYLAAPIRDAVRPYAVQWLPSMHPPILDRLIWWTAALFAFVATAGIGTWLTRFKRQQPYGLSEPNRTNQGAGFLLGALKGLVIASFLAAGFAQFAPKYVPEDGQVAQHTKESRSLAWNAQYHPAETIWNWAPVQMYVRQIRLNGLGDDAAAEIDQPGGPSATAKRPETQPDGGKSDHSAESKPRDEPLKTARRGVELSIPADRPLDPRSPTFRDDVARELKRLKIEPPKSR